MIKLNKVKKFLGRRDVMIGILLGLIIYCAIRNCNIKEGYRRRGNRKKSTSQKMLDKIPSLSSIIAAPGIVFDDARKKRKEAKKKL